MQPDISVISVTYNSESVIGTFLETLQRVVAKLNLSVETILTDNASRDRTQEILRDAHTKFSRLDITAIFNEKNVGLSQALNHMLRLCRGNRILICNPDIAFTESIQEMLKISEQRPALVLVPELLQSDGTVQAGLYRRFPTVLRIISDITAIGRSVPIVFDRVRKDYTYAGRKFGHPVDRLEHTSAICMLMNRETADMFSPFYDPAFPIYWNDVDMSKRAEVLGIQCAIVPVAKIYHSLGHSVKKTSPEKLAMFFYSSSGMIGYARRWSMHPNALRLVLFCDSFFKIVRDVANRLVGKRTRRLARTNEVTPFREATATHLLPLRCSLR